jgi:RNA-binding protein 8A
MADEVDYDSDSIAVEDDDRNNGKRSFKGRGSRSSGLTSSRSVFDRLDTGDTKATKDGQKSVEGYILFVSNVHEEAQEEDLLDSFQEVADVANIHLNLDRRTGFVKGYALLEFKELDDAKSVIKEMNNKELLGQRIQVDWAFVKDGDKNSKQSGSQRSRRQ